MMIDQPPPIAELRVSIRAQILRGAFDRLTRVLSFYGTGPTRLYSDRSEESYLKLLGLCREILDTEGFEELSREFPDHLPRTLSSMGDDIEVEWQLLLSEMLRFTGELVRFFVETKTPRAAELEAIFFETHDQFLDEYSRIKEIREAEFIEGIESDVHDPQDCLLPIEVVQSKRKYLESIVNQINGCYQDGWFDACSVMIRRLFETMIIDCFELHGLAAEIQGNDRNFMAFEALISRFTNETSWNLGRQTKRSLSKLATIKMLGDLSAHSRRYTARRRDIDDVATEIRLIYQELAAIAYEN